MNRIQRKVEYALIALKYMAKKHPGELTSAKEISEAFQTPFDATARVLQVMGQHGLLHVEQGVRGGYLIVKDLAKVSFLELIEMITGPVSMMKCRQQGESCELFATCNIHSPLMALNKKLNEFYQGLMLSEILRIKETHSRDEAALGGLG